jgi:Tol biopolymer transport system component
MRTPPVPFSAISLIIATLISCGGDDLAGTGGPGPPTGSLRVTTRSGGVGADPDGYLLGLDGAEQGAIGDPAPVVLTGLPAGDHMVALDGVVLFCAVEGGPGRTITVPAGDTADVAFTVICRATGSLEVSVSTSGGTPDLDGYAVSVDGAPGLPIAPNGTLNVDELASGSHVVTLSGLAFNCQGGDPNSWSGSVSPGAATSVRFTVNCGTLAPWRPVYQAWRPGGDGGQLEVFAVDLEKGVVINLSQSPDLDDEDPALSPDGSRVAFARADDTERLGLAVVNVDGTELRTLATADWPNVHLPTWSPDGSRIAFTRGASLYVINADGTGERYVGPFGPPANWSPDGTHIAAVGGPDFRSPDIWVLPAGGGQSVNLTPSATPEVEAVWSPDGRRLAFTRRTMRDLKMRTYYEDVWVMNADGSDQRRLTESSGAVDYAGARRPRWSPDGKLILFESSLGYEPDLYTIGPDGTALTNLTNTPDIGEAYADWSLDGSKIVFVSQSEPDYPGPDAVFMINADGSARANLSNYPNVDIP